MWWFGAKFDQERRQADVKALYPDGIHTFIANFLRGEDVRVKASSLLESEQGLSQELLDWADVLVWWSHCQHGALAEQIVERCSSGCSTGWASSPCTPRRAPSPLPG